MTERLSKSARKRLFKEEEEAAEQLALLSDRDLKNFPGSRDLINQIAACRRLKGGARKRQIKYLAKVMRQGSVSEIFDYLAEKKGSRLRSNRLHNEAERLRDVIINEALESHQYCLQTGTDWEPDWAGEAIDAVVKRYPLDEADLRKSVFQYTRTRVHNHYREIFRILKAALEKEELQKKI